VKLLLQRSCNSLQRLADVWVCLDVARDQITTRARLTDRKQILSDVRALHYISVSYEFVLQKSLYNEFATTKSK